MTAIRSIVSVAAAGAVLGVLLVPLCGGLAAAHACPMEAAMQGHAGGCQGPSGHGLKRQPMDCCVAPQATSPPAMPSVTQQVPAPVSQPVAIVAIGSLATARLIPIESARPRPLDLFSIHTSLLL